MQHIMFFVLMLIGFLAPAHTQCQEQFWTQTYIKTIEGFWGDVESASGPGSTLEQTAAVRNSLQNIIRDYTITSILDVPCGDFHWMSSLDLVGCTYIGGDIVKPLIENNIKKYTMSGRVFMSIDAINDALPKADLIICRDLLVHLSLEHIFHIMRNIKRSGARYLLTTTFTNTRPDMNINIKSGGWRTINLQKAPFNFPAPLLLINEHCSEQNGVYSDKSLGLWLIEDIVIQQ